MGSCSSPILVEQATEQVSSMNAAFSALIYDGQSGGWIWRLELQRPMRPVPVVVLDVDSQDLLQVPATHDEQPVQALGPHRPDPALGVGVSVGAFTGVTNTLASSEQNMSSNPRQNFASRSRTRKRTRHPRSSRTSSRLRACWVTRRPLGLGVIPAKWTRRVSSSALL